MNLRCPVSGVSVRPSQRLSPLLFLLSGLLSGLYQPCFLALVFLTAFCCSFLSHSSSLLLSTVPQAYPIHDVPEMCAPFLSPLVSSQLVKVMTPCSLTLPSPHLVL